VDKAHKMVMRKIWHSWHQISLAMPSVDANATAYIEAHEQRLHKNEKSALVRLDRES
jgi:hypothetical protein